MTLEQYRSVIEIEESNRSKEHPGLLRLIVDVLETLLLSVVFFAAINAVSARIRVDGSSMEPTLHSGEFVLVDKISYKIGKPQIGDVIVFHYPRDPHQEYIKRVIGLPGDHVVISGGRVYVNGQPLEEDYIAASPAYEATWDVPEDALFVLGDNRNNSSDSHNWGTVPLDYVVGKAVLIYWPPTSWGLIDRSNTAVAAP